MRFCDWRVAQGEFMECDTEGCIRIDFWLCNDQYGTTWRFCMRCARIHREKGK